jgi:cysteinyl-tRNA synthetase
MKTHTRSSKPIHSRSTGSRFTAALRHTAALVLMAGALTVHGHTLTIIGDTSANTTTTDSSPTRTWNRRNQTTTTTTTSPTTTTAPITSTTTTTATTAANRGFPNAGPWASFYGTVNAIDLPKMAATFRIMDIDADPDMGNFTVSQINTLKNGGTNKVLSYLNLGSCENFRGYWSTVPHGFLSCSANKAAQLGTYSGYSNEVWMNVGNADYQNLVINYIVPRLAAQGVDGFYFDNMEIVEHGTDTTNGPCDAQCSQGGLNLIAKLRDKYPSMLFVLQNATSNKTRLGQATGASGTVAFPSLLDGIAHEEVYKPTYDSDVEAELVNWSGMNLTPGGRKFWIGTLDYVNSCTNTTAAESAFQSSRARGFSPSVSDSSAGQQTVCYWPAAF